MARVRRLAALGLDVVKNFGFCTFPMRGTKGLFEIRKNGVRLYGGRLRGGAGSEVLVLLGAEQKGGKKEASPALLRRCEVRLGELKRTFAADQESAGAPLGGKGPRGGKR